SHRRGIRHEGVYLDLAFSLRRSAWLGLDQIAESGSTACARARLLTARQWHFLQPGPGNTMRETRAARNLGRGLEVRQRPLGLSTSARRLARRLAPGPANLRWALVRRAVFAVHGTKASEAWHPRRLAGLPGC